MKTPTLTAFIRTAALRPLALGAALLAGLAPALAALPSVEAVVHFSGNRTDGTSTGAYPPNGIAAASYPERNLVEDAQGGIHGTTPFGGGSVINPASSDHARGGTGGLFYRWREDTGQQALDRSATSGLPIPSKLTRGSDGHLYDRTGGLRRYDPATGWVPLATFGSELRAPWVEGSDGRLYNASFTNVVHAVDKDGAGGITTAFSMPASSHSRAVLFMAHSSGHLYGVVRSNAAGSQQFYIYKARPDGTDYTEVPTHPSFSTVSELIEATDGRIYGIARTGGANNTGLVFRLAADGTGFAVLHELPAAAANTQGVTPTSLTAGQDGHVYGTTSGGGIHGHGVIFRWNTVLERYETLHAFGPLAPHATPIAGSNNIGTNLDGKTPYSLMQARDGRFYGITSLGGQDGWGTLFRFTPGDEVPVFEFRPQLGFSASTRQGSQTVAATTVALGHSVSFAWRGLLVSNCMASSNETGNPWSGSRGTTSLGEAYVPSHIGTWTYRLRCDSTSTALPDPVEETRTLQVVSASPAESNVGNGGGGGALGWLAGPLALLGALAWRRRRLAA